MVHIVVWLTSSVVHVMCATINIELQPLVKYALMIVHTLVRLSGLHFCILNCSTVLNATHLGIEGILIIFNMAHNTK